MGLITGYTGEIRIFGEEILATDESYKKKIGYVPEVPDIYDSLTGKEYLTFILEQLSDLEGISYRAMMGEYIIYYREKIVGGIYDDRLLVKPVKSAVSLMPNAIYELPYDGAKEMLLVDEVDNKEFLTGLFHAMYDELPAPKPKKKKQTT